MGDRRRLRRFQCKVRVRWSDGEIVSEGHTWDVSSDGGFICSNPVMPANRTVDLEFFLATGSSVRCRGRVAWVNRGQLESYPPGFGVEFLSLESGAIERILDCYDDADLC
mgnify:FL=1